MYDEYESACMSCGHGPVSEADESGLFCEECLDHGRLDETWELFDDLGVGD